MGGHTPLVAGADAGGGAVRVRIADTTGRLLGRGAAAGANFQLAGAEVLCARLAEALRLALREAGQAGTDPPRITALVLGTSGADRPADRRHLAASIRRSPELAALGVTAETSITVDNDAVVALAAAGLQAGIVAVAGTGSIVYGFAPAGGRARAGGWGPLVSDEGSGFDLGRRALAAALQALDGCGPATILTRALPRAMALPEGAAFPPALLPELYGVSLPRDRIAALAPVVGRCAGEGDPVARAILREGAACLAAGVAAVFGRLDWAGVERVPVVAAGGVFRIGPYYDAFAAAVRERLPAVRVLPLSEEPATGALSLALQAAGGGPQKGERA